MRALFEAAPECLDDDLKLLDFGSAKAEFRDEWNRLEVESRDYLESLVQQQRQGKFRGLALSYQPLHRIGAVLRTLERGRWWDLPPGPRALLLKSARTYRADLSTFCERWRLNADWAVPVVVDSHLMNLECPGAGELFNFPAFYVGEEVPEELDIPNFDRLGGALQTRSRYRWDGGLSVPSRSGGSLVSITSRVEEEIAEAQGASVTERQRRRIRPHIDAQMATSRASLRERAALGEARYVSAPRPAFTVHCRRLAANLLVPEFTYEQLGRLYPARPDLSSFRSVRGDAVGRSQRALRRELGLPLVSV